MHLLKKLLIFIFVSSLFSCASYIRDFELVNENYKLKPDSISIVPGGIDKPSQFLCTKVITKLKEESKFDVKDFKYINDRIPMAENLIQEQHPESAGFDDEREYGYYLSGENLIRLNEVQKKLKTKYIYVVWVGRLSRVVSYSSRGGSNTSYQAYIFGRLLEYPKNEVVGFTYNGYSKGKSCCLTMKSEDDDINALLEKSANIIVKKIVQNTK